MIRPAYHYAAVVCECIFGEREPFEIKFIYLVDTVAFVPLALVYAYDLPVLNTKSVV